MGGEGRSHLILTFAPLCMEQLNQSRTVPHPSALIVTVVRNLRSPHTGDHLQTKLPPERLMHRRFIVQTKFITSGLLLGRLADHFPRVSAVHRASQGFPQGLQTCRRENPVGPQI